MILGIETSCDETAAAVVTAGRAACSRRSSRRRRSSMRATAGSCPRSPRAVISSSSARSSARPSPRRTSALGEHHADRRHARAGPHRRPPRRPLGGQGDRVVARASRSSRSTIFRGTSRRCISARHPSSRPSSACSRAAATRSCWPCGGMGRSSGSGRRSTTPPARRSTRVRDCSGCRIPGGAEIDALARQGDPEAFRFPVARVPGLDFSFSGVKTVAALRRPRPRRGGPRRAPRRSRGLVPARDRPRPHAAAPRRRRRHAGIERIAVVGGVAANSRAPGGAARCRPRAARRSAPTTPP